MLEIFFTESQNKSSTVGLAETGTWTRRLADMTFFRAPSKYHEFSVKLCRSPGVPVQPSFTVFALNRGEIKVLLLFDKES